VGIGGQEPSCYTSRQIRTETDIHVIGPSLLPLRDERVNRFLSDIDIRGAKARQRVFQIQQSASRRSLQDTDGADEMDVPALRTRTSSHAGGLAIWRTISAQFVLNARGQDHPGNSSGNELNCAKIGV